MKYSDKYSSARIKCQIYSLAFLITQFILYIVLFLAGARGDTRRALQTAVCVPPNFNCVHDQMKKLKDKLANSLLMASQIYYNSGTI